MDDWLQQGEFFLVFDWHLGNSSPIPISLSQCIAEDHSECSSPQSVVHLPDLSKLFDCIFDNIGCFWPESSLVDDDLPLSVLAEFQQLEKKSMQSASYVEIYTDGSFTPKIEAAGWAYVVIGYDQKGDSFAIHAAWGPLVTEPLHECWCGANRIGSKEAEVEALLHAVTWRIASSLTIPVRFRFDSIAAGYVAAGFWGHSHLPKHERVLRSFVQMSQTMYPGTDSFEHVRGHQGVLGNELADVLARIGSRQEEFSGIRPLHLFPYINEEEIATEWLWLWSMQIEPDVTFPTATESTLSFRPEFTKVTVDEAFPQVGQVTTCENPKAKFVSLGFLTYNVCSLKDGVEGQQLQGHVLLREQLVAHGVHFAFLQETRSRTEGMTISSTHIRCFSAAYQGRGGTEVWLLRFKSGSSKTLVNKDDIVVIESNPELLALKVRYFGKWFFLISGHCPQSGRSDDDIDKWWRDLHLLVQRSYEPHLELVLGLDANAHFNHEIPNCIGIAGLEEKSNRSSLRCAEFLQVLELCLPSTFPEIHVGEHVTWRRSAKTEGARCDYLIIPQAWRKHKVTSTLVPTVDAGTTTFDHTPVGLWVDLQFMVQRRPVNSAIDRDAIKHVTPAQLYELETVIPKIGWSTNVHAHAMKLTTSIVDWLRRTFPLAASSPKRSYISDKSWAIRDQRLQLQRSLRRCKHMYSQYYAGIALFAWKFGISLGVAHDLLWHVLFFIFRTERQLYGRLRCSKSELRKLLRQDRTDFLSAIAEEAQQAPSEKFFKILKKAGVVSRKFRCGPQPLPKLLLEDGTLAQTRDQMLERWRSFFAQQEDGYVVSPEELIADCTETAPILEVSWRDIPTLSQYEASMRRMKPGKALFWDEVPGEIFRYGASVLGKICFPLLLKQCATEQEPLLFQGGRLTPLYKKGPVAECSSYRSIFISPVLAKIHHRLFRERLAPYFEKYSMPMQLGGRVSKSVSQASHALQLALASIKAKGWSSAVLFVDIANAFYKAIRQQIMPTPTDLRTVQQLFQMLKLDTQALDDFVQFMQADNAFDRAGAPSHLQHLIANGMSSTWFGISSSPHLTKTRRGTRPGDCYADIVFSFAFSRLLSNLLLEYRELGCCQVVLWSGIKELQPSSTSESLEYLGPIWADDLAVLFCHPQPMVLYDLVQQAARKLIEKLTLGGLAPNYGLGKTEVLATWRGPQSVKLRRQIAQDGYVMSIDSALCPTQLRLVGSYKHLGTWLQVDLLPVKEFRMRFGIAHSTLTSLKISVFRNSSLPLRKKIMLFDSLIASGLFYNSATWMPLRPSHQRLFNIGYGKLLRRVAILHFGFFARDWSNERLFEQLDVLPAELCIRASRLRYLGHLLTAGGDDIWSMLQQHFPWVEMLVDDIKWLQAQRRFPFPFGSLLDDWSAWSLYILESPKRWKRVVAQACCHARVQQTIKTHWAAWNDELVEILIDFGGVTPPVKGLDCSQEHYCVRCSKVFSTKAAWAVHCFRVHQRFSPSRLVAQDRTCGHCLTLYPTHTSLINHLRYAVSCRVALLERQAFVDPQPSINSRIEIDQRPLLQAPPTRTEGPQLPSLNRHEGFLDFSVHQMSLLFQVRDLFLRFPSLSSVELGCHLLKEVLQQTTLHQSEIEQVLLWWWHQDLLGVVDGQFCAWATCVQDFLGKLCASFFFEPPASCDPRCAGEDQLTEWCSQIPVIFVVQRPLRYRPVVMGHLFSGRRRPNDVQEALESLSLPRGHDHMILSIDIIFSEEAGNLLDPSVFRTFREAIVQGLLIILYAGPPCETWSRARLRGWIDGGPKPVRSLHSLRGVCPLSLKEASQVDIGNELLGVAVRLATWLLIYGGMFVLEHPAIPPEPEAPAIWKTPALRFLRAQKQAQFFFINAGDFGAPSTKPTAFLVLNGPAKARDILLRHRVSRSVPLRSSIGKGTDNQWLTSVLKEYPPALCSGLAQLALEHVRGRDSQSSLLPLPDEAVQKFRDLVVGFDLDAQRGPDFHPVFPN